MTDFKDWDDKTTGGFSFVYENQSWTFQEHLNSGGFAKAFLVTGEDGVDYVFKVLHQAVDEKKLKNEFVRLKGAQNLRGCKSPRHLLLQKVSTGAKPGADERVVGIVYEYAEGETLESLINLRHGDDEVLRLMDSERIDLTLKILDAIESLHENNLVHRDIKPGNIVVSASGREAFLIDFGLTAPFGNQTRLNVGTPFYMPPEGVTDAISTDLDVYGFCASILEWLMGKQACAACFTEPEGDGFSYRFVGLANADLDHLSPILRNLAVLVSKGLDPDKTQRLRDLSMLKDLILQLDDQEHIDGERITNETVDQVLSLRKGGAGVLAVGGEFVEATRVDTKLEESLLPGIVGREYKVVFLSGNPGDGKTTFLMQVKAILEQVGSQSVIENSKYWELDRDGWRFAAILDASESDADTSSDERLAALLRRSQGDGMTALVAINDGRLDSFLRTHSDEFEFASTIRRQLRGQDVGSQQEVLVDLKKRSLASLPMSSAPGLGVAVLDRLVQEHLWSRCSDCRARMACPIIENVYQMRKTSVRSGIARLLAISHYRREQRVTLRDLRSVFAYLITGDRSCQDVHLAVDEGRNLRRARGTLFYDLAFDGSVDDVLFSSWKQVDPARLSLAALGRKVLKSRDSLSDQRDVRPVASYGRAGFFGVSERELGDVAGGEFAVYRYFDDFESLLVHASETLKQRILRGMSRILGAVAHQRNSLAILASEKGEPWVVLREFLASDFSVIAAPSGGRFVESTPDSVEVRWKGDTRVVLGIDDIELILRAEAGELFNDPHSSAVIGKLDGFASTLRTSATSAVTIVSPTGETFHAFSEDGQIEVVTA